MQEEDQNIIYWDRVRFHAESTYHICLKSSPMDEVNQFDSLEERGLSYLGDVFKLKVIGSNQESEAVAQYTAQILHLAIAKKKYQGYRNVDNMNHAALEYYQVGGQMRCFWYLRLLDIIADNFQISDTAKALQAPNHFWEHHVKRTKNSTKGFLDNFCFLWLSYNAHDTLKSIYESSVLFESGSSKISFKNKSGAAYKICEGICNSDKQHIAKWLKPHYERSKRWYEISAEYPWWERLIWAYTYHLFYQENSDTTALWHDLRGY